MNKNFFVVDKKYLDMFKKLGINVEEVLKKAQLPQDLFSRKSQTMTVEEYIKLMEVLENLSKDESIALKIGSVENLETFSPPIFAAYCSKNALI